jgi:Microsomal signal peptidase 25 kDa subunit (SPC25)
MRTLDFVQSHSLSDIRLAIGYTAVIACAAAAYYEYKVGFQEAKSWNILAVVTYFTLNSALYLWGWFIEGDTVYVGRKGDITVLPACVPNGSWKFRRRWKSMNLRITLSFACSRHGMLRSWRISRQRRVLQVGLMWREHLSRNPLTSGWEIMSLV